MPSLLLTLLELKEVSELLNAEPTLVGLYWHEQVPLKMFQLNNLTVALLIKIDEPKYESVIAYNKQPIYERSMPDIIKHCAAQRNSNNIR